MVTSFSIHAGKRPERKRRQLGRKQKKIVEILSDRFTTRPAIPHCTGTVLCVANIGSTVPADVCFKYIGFTVGVDRILIWSISAVPKSSQPCILISAEESNEEDK